MGERQTTAQQIDGDLRLYRQNGAMLSVRLRGAEAALKLSQGDRSPSQAKVEPASARASDLEQQRLGATETRPTLMALPPK